MNRIGIALVIGLLTVGTVAGDFSFIIDLLDPSDPGGSGVPSNVAIVDFYVSVTPGDAWTVAGMQGRTWNGAMLQYVYVFGEPNLVFPGENRWVTFLETPYPGGRDDQARFTWDQPQISGAYCPTAADPVADPFELNVVWYDAPCPGPGDSGWLARISVRIDTAGVDAEDLAFVVPGSEPPNYVPLFFSSCPNDGGSVIASCDVTSPTGGSWGLYGLRDVLIAHWSEVLDGDLVYDVCGTPDCFPPIVGTQPVESYAGLCDSTDEDMYQIVIVDPGAFQATTIGGATWDTQLFLFDADGRGVVMNDDAPQGGTLQSRITGAHVPAPGRYFLAVSGYDRDPINRDGLEIWSDSPFTQERTPDGPGANNPFIQRWLGQAGGGGSYTISLDGARLPRDPQCAGDTNYDFVVDLTDLTRLLAHFGETAGALPTDGDMDDDGDVELNDLTILLATFGSGC